MQNDEPKFDSWRENLDDNKQQTGNKQENTNQQPKSVDGMGHFVSKEGFIIDEKPETRNQKSETISNDQNFHEERPTTPPVSTPPIESKIITPNQPKTSATPPPPPKSETPPPEPKKGFPRWLKIVILAVLALIIAGGIYLFFFYKSTLDISISQSGSKVILDKETISSGLNKVKPGNYTLKIEKEGFVPYSKSIEMKYFKKTAISVVLKEMPQISNIYQGDANYLAYNKESNLYLFYDSKELAIYRIDAEKIGEENITPILTSPHSIKNVVDIVWNPDRLTAIFKIKNDNAVLADTPFYKPEIPVGEIMTFLYDFGRYDLLHQEAKYWGTGIGDINFTPKGDQVAYYFEPGNGEKSLVVANKDNSAMNRIADLRDFTNPLISWSPDLKNIVLTNKSNLYDTNKVNKFSLIEKIMSPLTETGNNLDAVFDFEGKKIIYATYSSDPDFSNYSLLSVMDNDGQNKKELKSRSNISQTTSNSSLGLILLGENEKDKYFPFSINLEDLKKTEYVFSGEINNPISIEYIESKNSIIFIDQNKAKILFLTTKEYE